MGRAGGEAAVCSYWSALLRGSICGLMVFVMAASIGLKSFSGAWWAFILATNMLAGFAGWRR
jgi:hypothetical protein